MLPEGFQWFSLSYFLTFLSCFCPRDEFHRNKINQINEMLMDNIFNWTFKLSDYWTFLLCEIENQWFTHQQELRQKERKEAAGWRREVWVSTEEWNQYQWEQKYVVIFIRSKGGLSCKIMYHKNLLILSHTYLCNTTLLSLSNLLLFKSAYHTTNISYERTLKTRLKPLCSFSVTVT